MRTKAGILLSLFLFSILAATNSNAGIEELDHCTALADDANRLSCYDAAADFSKPGEAENTRSDNTSEVYSGGWEFSEHRDAFSNKETSMVILESDAVGETMSDKPALTIIRCDGKGSKEVIVRTHGYLGSDRIRVRYKFGDNDPILERWSPSTSGQAVFLPRGYKDFLKGIKTGESFIFEVTDFQGSRAMAEFINADKGKDDRDYVLNGCKKWN
jgi:hypothetical protein